MDAIKTSVNGKRILNKAYVFRIYPTEAQIEQINQFFGNTRFVYNHTIFNNQQCYGDGVVGKFIPILPSSLKEKYPFLKLSDSLHLSNVQLHVQSAFNRAFSKETYGKRQAHILKTKNKCRVNKHNLSTEILAKKIMRSHDYGKPQYKRKDAINQSFTTNMVNGNIKLNDTSITLPKMDAIKIIRHRPIFGQVKAVTLSRVKRNFYEVSILTEYENNVQLIPPQKLFVDKVLGVDYSSTDFAVYSNGKKANYPKYFRKSVSKLSRLQRKFNLARKRNNYNAILSKGEQILQVEIAKLHYLVKQQRLNFLHNEANRLLIDYDVIGVEDINLAAIAKCLKLARNTYDNGFGMFRNILEYKAREQGKYLVRIDKWFPSTQIHHSCKHKNDVALSERKYLCGNCGEQVARDYNAALNIRDESYHELIRIYDGEIDKACDKRNKSQIKEINYAKSLMSTELNMALTMFPVRDNGMIIKTGEHQSVDVLVPSVDGLQVIAEAPTSTQLMLCKS